MNDEKFEKGLEDILWRYIPLSGDKDKDESTIKILKIRICDLYEEVGK